ncbi:MAG: insulinase family protein [Myxococcaceae bacterium]|nr:insulinase family protein [Myxococcaceae bacterium]
MTPFDSAAARLRSGLAVVGLLLVACKSAPAPRPETDSTTADAGTVAVAASSMPDPAVKPASPVPARPLATTTPMQVVKLATPRPIVSLRLAFRAGSIDDPPGKEGLTALTTRLLVEGGTKTYSSAQLLDVLYPLAGEIDASTDKELSVISGRVHKDKLDAFLKVFTEVLLDPRFDEKELERLKTAALNSIKNRLRSENDEALGKVTLDALLYAGHPYGHYVGGTVKGLTSITMADVKAHWKNVMTQDRLIIGLAGPVDVKLENAVKAAAKKLPEKGVAAVTLPPAPGPLGQTLIVKKDTASTAGSFGFTYSLRRGDPDFFAVALALSYLGEHRQMHGVLFTELREKRGLNYGTYAYAEHFEQEGWSSISRVNIPRSTQESTLWLRPVEPQNAMFATRGAVHYLSELLKAPPPADKLDTARGFLIGYTRIWEQTDPRRLGWLIDDLLYGTPGHLEKYRAALAKLTPEEVQAAAARHLDVANLNFVFVTKDAEGLAQAVKARMPSPITYPSPKAPDVLETDKVIAEVPLPTPSTQVRVIDAATVMEQ